jgi:hypothetical protein
LAPAHRGEFNRSGLAGITPPLQFVVGLLSETEPPGGVAARSCVESRRQNAINPGRAELALFI